MRLRAFVAVSGLTAIMLLNGCGGGTTSQTSSTSPTANGTVNFVVTDTRRPMLRCWHFRSRSAERCCSRAMCPCCRGR